MLDHLNIERILFLDIETVPEFPEYSQLPERQKALWDHKASFIRKENDDQEITYKRAGIYAEFGKIICISVGLIKLKTGKAQLKIKSFYGDDEQQILVDFIELFNKRPKKPDLLLCAHNGKEFDFPYLSRRILINGLKLPATLKIQGKKPWEVPHVDTLDLWRFGDYKNYTSLEVLASVFKIPSPKNDIKGSDVCRVYWEEKNLERIVNYCRNDVITIVQLFRRFNGESLIDEADILVV